MGSSASLAVNPLLYAKLPYDPKADFTGVSMLATSPLVMVVNPGVPAKTVKDFIVLAKAQPGKYNFASVGNGNPLHLAGELFKTEAGVEMTHIPYNGSAPALTALIGNQVQVMFDVVLTAAPHIKAGKINALGITGRRRLAILPGVPTVMPRRACPATRPASGLRWSVPKATPAAIVARLNAEVTKILKQGRHEDQVRRPGAGADADQLGGSERVFGARAEQVVEVGEGEGDSVGAVGTPEELLEKN